jgi:ribose transport system substrate-binding protein
VKRRRSILSALIVLALLVVACGGGGGSAGGSGAGGSDTEATLGLAMIDLTHPFFVRMKKAGDEAAQDYGVQTVWQSAEGSVENEISIVEDYIQQKVDVILIDPLDAEATEPVIQKAKAAGIPVITMGNKVDAGWNYNTLYPDFENMAMVARALATSIGEEGQVALLTGSRGNYVSDTREAGFEQTIKKEFPNVELVATQPTEFDPAKAQDITETWMTTYPNLDGIAFISDPLGLAAKSAADSADKDLKYAGYDGDQEMHPLLEQGSMVIDVLTGAERVGYWNIAVAARIAKGEQKELAKDLFLPTYFITTDETADQLSENGLRFDYLAPEESVDQAQSYSEEFGPNEPTSAMSQE